MRRFLATVLCGAILCAALLPARAAPAGAQLSPSVFPAQGTHEAILTVPVFGRYAIAVSSAQGVALQLVDRMAGPGDIVGAPGARDGRIDAFLERGSYKIRLIADAHGSGVARLGVVASAELSSAALGLVEDKPVSAALGDHQQISWWLSVPARGIYHFEAGGRYLDELRLWKDGAWMVDAAPIVSEDDADPERPLALRQLTAQLEPGLYRLTAYGGAGLPWAQASADQPFMLRWGIPALGDAGRFERRASALGIDRFTLPASATDVRLVLARSGPGRIAAQPFDDGSYFDQSQAGGAAIDKTSRDPVAELPLAGDGRTPWLVTVTLRPGESYALEVFNAAGGQTGIGPGPLSELAAATLPGDADDEIDAGFIMVDDRDQSVRAASAIELDQALPWRRRFNLLGPAQTVLHTARDLNLVVSGSGAAADFVVDRFFTQAPPDRVVPSPQPSGATWPLTPGYYVLSVTPRANGLGILTLSLTAAGGPAPSADSPRLPAPVFADVEVPQDDNFTLYSSLGYGTPFGLEQESLPAALATPLSLELGPRQSLSFGIAPAEDGRLSVTDESGAAVPFTLDGVAANGALTVTAGTHQLGLIGPAGGERRVMIADLPARLLDTAALPVIPPAATAPPALPALAPDAPVFTDFARGQAETFAVPVGRDALYQFETTGLLETGGAIRTRTNPSLMQAEGNGVGRNFLLNTYLREGDYQLTVQTEGQTAGHAGIALSETPVREAGLLAAGLPARLTIAPGEAAAYRFHIPAAGSYHLFTLGLGHQFAMRLEDADGWPLLTPGGVADATMDFSPGDYRMILLPGPVENRAVTLLDPILPAPVYQGHGPFQLSFGTQVSNRWMEPAAGAARMPDRWDFTLPAAATLTMTIDNGMRAELRAAGAGGALLAVTGNEWSGTLPAGDYEIAAMSAVPDSRVDYDLEITTAELIPGQSRDIQAPASLDVALGGAGQYDISSFGDQDVRAALYDSQGRLVAANDDRDNDWNFLISGAFSPGRYRLLVDPVGGGGAATTVSISAPVTVRDPALRPGVSWRIADGAVHVMALPAAAPGQLLVAGATGASALEMALEAAAPGQVWRSVATAAGTAPYVAVPAAGGAAYRLRVWAEDHGDSPIDVTALAVSAAPAAPGALAAGLALTPVTLGARRIGVARVDLPQAGLLRLDGAGDTLTWSGAAGLALAHDGQGVMLAAGGPLWLADAAPRSVTARPIDLLRQSARLTLGPGQRLALALGPEAGGLALWEALAQGGQAGIAVSADGGAGPMAWSGGGLLRQTLAFQGPELASPVLSLWQAGTAADALPLTVRRIGFGAPAAFTVGVGSQDGVIDAGGALEAGLPAGWNRLALSLPAGVVAVLLRDGSAAALIEGDGATPDLIESQAQSLLLLNPSGDAAAYSLSVQPIGGPSLVLSPGGMVTHYGAGPARLHIAISRGAMPLRIAGAASAITAIDAAGRISDGDGALAGAGGAALVTAGPGLAVISMDGPDDAALPPQPVTAPASVALSGPAVHLQLPPGPARLVHLETDGPVILRAAGTGAPSLFADGAAANLFQPKGAPLDVILRAAGAAPLAGAARLETIPALPITDGLGPRFLVPPGGSRLFTFSLDAARSIGAGVRGSVDDGQVRLLASDGTELARGLVLIRSLEPGTYYLAVDVPADGVATMIQPALAGLTLPDDGPPDDVKAQYYALAGLQPN